MDADLSFDRHVTGFNFYPGNVEWKEIFFSDNTSMKIKSTNQDSYFKTTKISPVQAATVKWVRMGYGVNGWDSWLVSLEFFDKNNTSILKTGRFDTP